MKEGVVGAEEQVGAVAPGAQVEEKLPGTLRHLGGISRLEATPLGQGLQVRRWVAISAGGPEPGSPDSGVLQAARCWGGLGPVPTAAWSVTRAHVRQPRAKLSAQLSSAGWGGG